MPDHEYPGRFIGGSILWKAITTGSVLLGICPGLQVVPASPIRPPVQIAAAFLINDVPDSPNTSTDSDVKVLEQLLADYRAYGLPFPPAHSELIMTRRGRGVYNGVEEFSYDILFREIHDKKPFYWVGCEIIEPCLTPDEVQKVQPSVILPDNVRLHRCEPRALKIRRRAEGVPRWEDGRTGPCRDCRRTLVAPGPVPPACYIVLAFF